MTSRFEFPKTEDGWKQLIKEIASLYGLNAFIYEDLPASRRGWEELWEYIERAFPPCDEIREV